MGGQQGGTVAILLMLINQNVCQNVIFDVLYEVKKDSEDISEG
jgi:hypothetical protein